MANADHGWRILRLAALLRTLELHQDQAHRILHRIEPSMRASFAKTLKARQIETLHREAREVAQLAEQIEALLEALPENEPISIQYDDVRTSAERVLRQDGTLDATTVLLAVQVLHRSTGLSALAECLRSSGAYTAWGTTTTGSLIGAVRGVSPQLVRRVATDARMAPGTEIARCHPDEIALLADQLDRHAQE